MALEKYLLAGILGLGITGCANTAYPQESQQTPGHQAQTSQEQKEEPASEKKDLEGLTEERIEKLMKYETVEEILNEKEIINANIEYVKYDPEKKTTNYDTLVFQEHLKPEQRKPVLVFFYHNKDPPQIEGKGRGAELREAIFFKLLSKKYVDKIRFLCYDLSVDPEKAKNNWKGVADAYDIRAPPSIAMYGLFDLAKGETPEKNDGEIKRIDTLKGGPGTNEVLIKWLSNFDEYWAQPNITNPNGEYTYRFSNTGNVSKVNIEK